MFILPHNQVKIDLSVFPDFEDDVAFMKNLIAEQGVVGLPGSVSSCVYMLNSYSYTAFNFTNLPII